MKAPNKEITTIQDAQKVVKDFATNNGWEDLPNVDKFDHLHEELIEMSKHLRYKSQEERISYVQEHPEIFIDGIGDLFFAMCRLANQLNVDIKNAFNQVSGDIISRYNQKGNETKIIK